MGYDCTLHLVDERAILRELVPRLLGKSRKALAFEQKKQGSARLRETREALEHADPREAARALSELAIQFASTTLPHVEARGIALSLWENAPKKARGASPVGLGASPEQLFAEVVRRRPDLAGAFPTHFDENWMTGVFIPAARIKGARAWLGKQLAALSPGERLRLEPIERVLAAAEKHRLGYWEATDLDVAQASEELLGGDAPSAPRGRWKMPRQGADRLIGRVGDQVFLRLGDDSLGRVDIGKVPPKIDRLSIDYPTFVAHIAGRWVSVERRKDARPFRFRLYLHQSGLDAPAAEAAPSWPGRALADVGAVGGRVFARDADTKPPVLLRWTGKTLEPVPKVAPARGHKGMFVFGFATTGDGADVLVWDGDGYELVGEKLVKTFPLGAVTKNGGWASAPSGDGSFHYTLDGQLFLAERRKKPRAVATKTRNVQGLAAGPDGSVLLTLGDNRQAWAVALLREGRVVGLPKKEITHQDDEVCGIEWSSTAGSLFVFTQQFVVALPPSVFAT